MTRPCPGAQGTPTSIGAVPSSSLTHGIIPGSDPRRLDAAAGELMAFAHDAFSNTTLLVVPVRYVPSQCRPRPPSTSAVPRRAVTFWSRSTRERHPDSSLIVGHSASLRRSSQQASVAVPHNGAGPGAKGSPNGRATPDETIGRRWHPAVPGRGKGTKMNSIIYIIGLVVVVGAVLAFFGLR
jgi:hypothetical protein